MKYDNTTGPNAVDITADAAPATECFLSKKKQVTDGAYTQSNIVSITPCGRAKISVHVPLDCPPGPGPPSGASLGGPTMGQIGWGGPSTGPTLFFWCSRGVSVSV